MTNQVIHGDCMDILAEMEENSIDTIITDPPYGLTNRTPDVKRCIECSRVLGGKDGKPESCPRCGGKLARQRSAQKRGFMGKAWDSGIPGIPFWAEMLRVAKPGATLLAFGGTRTHHRLMVAIEDAGWEIRDCLMWLYGSGFPKSANISKMLDKQAGKEREVVGRYQYPADHPRPNKDMARWSQRQQEAGERTTSKIAPAGGDRNITAPATEAAKTFDGYGTGLKPAYEPIILAMKPIESTYANNALVHGVAGLNIDGSRIFTQDDLTGGQYSGTERQSGAVYGDHRNLSPEQYKQPSGRWPANVLMSHSEGCVYRGEKQVRGITGGKNPHRNPAPSSNEGGFWEIKNRRYFDYVDPNGLETVSDWECVDGCPIKILDEQAGVRKSGGSGKGHPSNNSMFVGTGGSAQDISDSGSASRFFYTAKAPNREKWFFCQLCAKAYPNKERDNHGHDIDQGQRKHIVAHPTVKPLEILKYLCTLTKTPSGGVVLDPFAGSGTTALACIETGRDFILIEKEADYYEIAKARVEDAMNEPRQAELF